MTDVSVMSNYELLNYLIDTASVPTESKFAYSAGYFESTLNTLMIQFPEVRKEIEYRVKLRKENNDGN